MSGLGVLGERVAIDVLGGSKDSAKNAQAGGRRSDYARKVQTARADEDPLRIEIYRPSEVSGIEVTRFTSDARLFTSVKERLAVAQNLAGQYEWWAHGRTWRSRPGTIQLKLPGEVHRQLRRDGPAKFLVVLFDEWLIRGGREALDRPFAPPPSLSIDGASPAGAPIATLNALLLSRSADPLALQTALVEAVAALVELTGAPPDSRAVSRRRVGEASVRRALDFIDARFTGAVTLDELAEHARLDKFHLARAFREQMGLPPYAYVTHRRVSRAQTLLRTGAPASEVAAQVGFCDQSQLNRHFKRIVGITPGQYAAGSR